MKIKMMSVKLLVGFTTKLNFAVYSVHKNLKKNQNKHVFN